MRGKLFIALGLFAGALLGDVKPNALFSDHMVLQSGMSAPVWGVAEPGERVTASVAGQTQSATAGADGKWLLRFKNLKPGGPFEMTIEGSNHIHIADILIGEVWLGSDQSNMEFTVSKKKARFAGLLNEDEEIAAANYPRIRMFTVKGTKSLDPRNDVTGEWLICNPENVPGFSAVGYLFARNLQKELGVPVGIVTSAFGASTAEAWIDRGTMASDPQLKPMLDKFDAIEKYYQEHPGALTGDAPEAPQTINARPGNSKAPLRDPVQDQHEPTVLFNGMIAPIVPYAIRGALWYQGESIVGGAPGVLLYPHTMKTLVKNWRRVWGEGDFPFYAVQLAALGNVSNNPMVREGQAKLTSLPHTAVAVTIDIGDPKDVHPHNKEPLGDRLTRIALANVYGKKIEFSGPVYRSMRVDGNSIRVTFAHAGSALEAKGGPLKWFQIAGEDQKFVEASARIDGDSVLVSSPDVAKPLAVRYAWDNYPEGCNLYNAAGLPAAPFRTDGWDALTQISKEFTGK
jgi:sialate O-acetylesterase